MANAKTATFDYALREVPMAPVWAGLTHSMLWRACDACLLGLAEERGILRAAPPALWSDQEALAMVVDMHAPGAAPGGIAVALEHGGTVGWACTVPGDGRVLGVFYAICSVEARARAPQLRDGVVPVARLMEAMKAAAWSAGEGEDTGWVWWLQGRRLLDGRASAAAGAGPGPAAAPGRRAVLALPDGTGKLARIGDAPAEDAGAWVLRPQWAEAWDALVAAGQTAYKSQTAAMWAVVRQSRRKGPPPAPDAPPPPKAGVRAILSLSEGRALLGRTGDHGPECDDGAWKLKPKWHAAWESLVAAGEITYASHTAAMWALMRRAKQMRGQWEKR